LLELPRVIRPKPTLIIDSSVAVVCKSFSRAFAKHNFEEGFNVKGSYPLSGCFPFSLTYTAKRWCNQAVNLQTPRAAHLSLMKKDHELDLWGTQN